MDSYDSLDMSSWETPDCDDNSSNTSSRQQKFFDFLLNAFKHNVVLLVFLGFSYFSNSGVKEDLRTLEKTTSATEKVIIAMKESDKYKTREFNRRLVDLENSVNKKLVDLENSVNKRLVSLEGNVNVIVKFLRQQKKSK